MTRGTRERAPALSSNVYVVNHHCVVQERDAQKTELIRLEPRGPFEFQPEQSKRVKEHVVREVGPTSYSAPVQNTLASCPRAGRSSLCSSANLANPSEALKR
jgi:hypothetical protein